MTLLDANVVAGSTPQVFGTILLSVIVFWSIASTVYGAGKNKLDVANKKFTGSKVR